MRIPRQQRIPGVLVHSVSFHLIRLGHQLGLVRDNAVGENAGPPQFGVGRHRDPCRNLGGLAGHRAVGRRGDDVHSWRGKDFCGEDRVGFDLRAVHDLAEHGFQAALIEEFFHHRGQLSVYLRLLNLQPPFLYKY